MCVYVMTASYCQYHVCVYIIVQYMYVWIFNSHIHFCLLQQARQTSCFESMATCNAMGTSTLAYSTASTRCTVRGDSTTGGCGLWRFHNRWLWPVASILYHNKWLWPIASYIVPQQVVVARSQYIVPQQVVVAHSQLYCITTGGCGP